MQLNNALRKVLITLKDYVDKMTPKKLSDLDIDIDLNSVKTINGQSPDENGNIEIETIVSWDELQNKPFGEEYGTIYYLEEQIVNLEEQDDFYRDWIYIPLNDLVYINNKYIVVFDGVEYEATLYEEEDGAFIGINYYYPSDNRDNLPFGLWFNEFESKDGEWGCSQLAAICTTDNSLMGEHTISIYAEGLSIHHLDPKYIKDMYYESPVEAVVVEETTITLEEGAEPVGMLIATQPLEVGQEYTVTLDGATYNCVAKLDEEFSIPYIGNAVLVGGEDTGESFFIIPMQSPIDLNFVIMVNSDVLEHTVNIVSNISEVHQIDEKFIPDSVKVHDWNTLKNRPFGTRIGKKYLIEPQTIVFDSEGRGYGEHIDDYWEYISTGTLCEIEFDGEIYTCITESEGADASYVHRFTTLSGIDVNIWDLRHFVAPGLSGEYTISLNVEVEVIDLIDEKFIPDSIVSMKMDSYNPSGEGKFSMNRQENSMEGVCSTTLGTGNIASSLSQHVIGEYNSVSSDKFTIGITQREENDPEKYNASETIYVSDKYTFDGTTREFTLIDPMTITAAEYSTIFTHTGAAKRFISRTITSKSIVAGYSRYIYWTDINSLYLYAPIIYSGVIQYLNRGKYAHIIGNGTSDTQRSNAHTVDWNGNAWYAGDVYIGGSGQDDEKANKLQKELDNSLDTEAKTIVDAINELKMEIDNGIVQSDWSQNDETASDYIKNRTHYIKESDTVVFEGSATFDDSGTYTFPESISLTKGGYYNIQLGDNMYSGKVMNFNDNKLYFTTPNSVKNYFNNTEIYIQEFANQTIDLTITKLGTNVVIDEIFLPSNVAKTDNIPTKLTDIKTTSKPYFILASTTENSTKNFKITVDDTGTLTVAEHCELYSAAFTRTSIRYTKQATLNIETTSNVAEIILLKENGEAMTATTTTSEIDTDGNKTWTLKFKPESVGVKTFTVYGITENNLETERADVFIYATRT